MRRARGATSSAPTCGSGRPPNSTSSTPWTVLLRATSDVRSRGRGPMELHGRRDGPRRMAVRQRIYRAGGGHIEVRSRATLRFADVGALTAAPTGRSTSWPASSCAGRPRDGSLGAVVRTGPKLNYCLRDLDRTRPGRRSPSTATTPAATRTPPGPGHPRHLGRLVGHLPGRLRQAVDQRRRPARLLRLHDDRRPQHLLYESNEHDNTSRRLVRLPFTGDTGA